MPYFSKYSYKLLILEIPLTKMLLSSINPGTHVTVPHSRAYPASIPLSRPSPNFPAIPGRHISLPRVRLSHSWVRSCTGHAFDFKAPKGINVFHEVEMKVRDYELNQYGVVNNAIYANYCQQGHHELLKRIGASSDAIAKAGGALAFSKSSFKFIAPLRNGDRFVVRARISSFSAARMFFEHLIFKIPNLEVIVEGKATGVWLDKNYCPVRIPPHVLSNILQFPGHQESS